MNLRVKEEGISPFARSRSLKRLRVSNQFKASDFALLSVTIPRVECEMFAPWIRVDGKHLRGLDRMIVGRPGELLNSLIDADRIASFEARFKALQEKHRQELGL